MATPIDIFGGANDDNEPRITNAPHVRKSERFSAQSVSGDPVLNIDYQNPLETGPQWDVEGWRTNRVHMKLLTEPTPTSCEETCAEKARIRKQKCAEVRKRVQLSLKEAGCPSRVMAPAAPAKKKKKTTKRRTRKR